MAGNSLGTAWIQIKPTTSGITSAVKSELGNVETEINGSGSKLTSAFTSLGKKAGAALKVGITAAATAAVTSAVSLIKSAVTEFAEYEQLVGGVDTLFKESSETVQEYAQNAFKTAQISANDYMETVTSFSASLLQSLGGDTAKAANYADQAIIDMADNANKMGTSMESIQYAYQGFAKQNYTMLDNLKLGYGGTKTEMERLLADASKLSGIKYDISSFADITAAIHVIQEDLGIAETSAKEASQTIQGSVNSMKASWNNLIVGMTDDTQDFGQLMDNFVSSASAAASNIIPRILQAMQGLSTLVLEMAPILTEQLPVLIETIVPPFIEAVIQLANAIILNLPMLVEVLLQGVLENLPALITGVCEMLPDLINGVVNFLTDPENIGLIIDAAVALFMGIVQAVPQILGNLIGALGNLLGEMWNWLTESFGKFAADFGTFLGDIFKGAINGVISFIENFINTPIDLINGFIGLINDAFGFIGVNLGKISRVSLPRLATGGVVGGIGTSTSDSNLVMLSKGEYVIKAAAAQSIGYDTLDQMNQTGTVAGNGVTIINNITSNQDPEEIANVVSRKIAFEMRGVMA